MQTSAFIATGFTLALGTIVAGMGLPNRAANVAVDSISKNTSAATSEQIASLLPHAVLAPRAGQLCTPWDWFFSPEAGVVMQYPSFLTKTTPSSPDELLGLRYPANYMPGTNLQSVTITVTSGLASDLPQPNFVVSTSSTVLHDGYTYVRLVGSNNGAGHFNDYIRYAVVVNGHYYILELAMHAVNPGVYANPPQIFNESQIEQQFDTIFATFKIDPPICT